MVRIKKIVLMSFATSLLVGGISFQAFSSKLSTTNSSAKNPVASEQTQSFRSVHLTQPLTADYSKLCITSCSASGASQEKTPKSKNKPQNSAGSSDSARRTLPSQASYKALR